MTFYKKYTQSKMNKTKYSCRHCGACSYRDSNNQWIKSNCKYCKRLTHLLISKNEL